MMLLLIFDIFVNAIGIGLTHGKCSITILPMKFPARSVKLLLPRQTMFA